MNKMVEKREIYRPRKPITIHEPCATDNFLKSFFISFAIMSVLAVLFYLPDAKNFIIDAFRLMQGKNTARFEFKLPFSPKRQNILVLGVDIAHNKKGDKFKGVRSDSLSLVSIAPYAKDVNIISIPRDSKVFHANSTRPDKINHAFAKGGINLTVDTIEETFGIRVDHYVVFSTQALITFIDEIGGLPIYVEKNMHYGDNSSKLYINLQKGEQVLSGKQAEGYMRFRNDMLGDIGRISRQQWFFNALAEKLKNPKTFILLPEAVKKSLEYVETDMSAYQLMQFAGLMKTINPSRIHTAVLPGSPSSKDEISYWILDPEKTQQVINALVYRDAPKPLNRPVNVGIMYTDNSKEAAFELQKQFEAQNYHTKLVLRNSILRNQISVHGFEVPIDTIDSIRHEYPQIKDLPITYDIVGFNRAGKDFTVILKDSTHSAESANN